MHDETVEPREEERTRREVRVSRDRSSGGRMQPDERPAGMPGRSGATGMCSVPELDDTERTRCEVWTRVMGYHRPVSSWNPGKQSEHRERQYFSEAGAPAR